MGDHPGIPERGQLLNLHADLGKQLPRNPHEKDIPHPQKRQPYIQVRARFKILLRQPGARRYFPRKGNHPLHGTDRTGRIGFDLTGNPYHFTAENDADLFGFAFAEIGSDTVDRVDIARCPGGDRCYNR